VKWLTDRRDSFFSSVAERGNKTSGTSKEPTKSTVKVSVGSWKVHDYVQCFVTNELCNQNVSIGPPGRGKPLIVFCTQTKLKNQTKT